MFPLLYSDHRLMSSLANDKPAAVSAGFYLRPSVSICGFPSYNYGAASAVLRLLRSLLFFPQKGTKVTKKMRKFSQLLKPQMHTDKHG